MGVLKKKQKVFGNIAAAKIITEGLPKFNLSSSFPSINNGGNSITFLTDLIKSLIGFEVLVESLVNILTHSLADIEREIKIALKTSLKDIVSCGVDPSLPLWVKSSSLTGIVIPVNKVDFFDLLKVDPTSVGGQLLYGDATDFNRFLYDVIQVDGTPMTWPTTGTGIIDVTFKSIGVGSTPNNTFTIKANANYNTKTLTDLNNDFIDSLTLFNATGIVNKLIDIIFGSVSISVKKTKKQLENEAKVNNVIDCMVNADAGETIDDNFFKFSNDDVYVHQQQADLRQKGILKLECCNKVAASVPVNMLTAFNADMTGATTTQDQKSVISTNLTKMADQNTVNSKVPSDKITIKLNFIQNLIQNLIKAIVGVVMSPKIIMVFMINYKIIYGESAEFGDGVDFIKKNKNLFNNIMKKITSMIIKILIAIALKEISKLVAEVASKREIEKGKNKLSQILSLVGISQDVIRIIKGLA